MDANLTRRTLFKIMAAHTGALLFGGVSGVTAAHIRVTDSDTVLCHKCDALNKSSALFSSLTSHSAYCHNCGVNLISFDYDKGLEPLKGSLLARDDVSSKISHSRYIPFPNHDYLVDCRKPKLQLRELQF
jgi:hypothetical protein